MYKNYSLKPQTNILLYGAPGTGKTLLASVVASECGLNFISIKVTQSVFIFPVLYIYFLDLKFFLVISRTLLIIFSQMKSHLHIPHCLQQTMPNPVSN